MSMAEIVVPLALAVVTCSLTGLIAVWAAVSRVHWFLRVAVLEAFLALWLIIPAYEILLVLLVQTLVVVLSLASLRLLRREAASAGEQTVSDPAASKRVRLRFSLRSLLLVFVAMAFLFPAVVSVVRNTADMEDSIWTSSMYWDALFSGLMFSRLIGGSSILALPWASFVLSGIGAGLGTLVAAWMTLRRGYSGALMIAGLVVVFAACWVRDLAAPWLGVCMAVLVSVAVWFALRRRTRRRRLGAVLLVMLVAAAPLGGPIPWLGQVLLYPILLCVPLAGWLALLRWAGWPKAFTFSDRDAADSRGGATWRPGIKRCARAAAVLVSLLVTLPLGVVFYKLATPTPKFQIDLPEPNGSNDLAQAGTLLQSVVEPATSRRQRQSNCGHL